MELIKERQSTVTTYDGQKATEAVTSISYRIKEGSGVVGNVEVRAYGFSMNVGSIPNKTVEQVGDMVKAMFASLTV